MIINKAERISDVKSYYFATKLQEVAKMNEDGDIPVINLGIGSPDIAAPDAVIDALQQASMGPLANKYQSYRGLPQLRQAFASWYKTWYGVHMDAEQEVLPLIGSKEGIMHISMSFLEKGDQVLVPNPGYPAYRMCATIAGAETVFYNLCEEQDWLPNLEEIESTVDIAKVKIMWINYPHMPTGAKATKAFYEKLIPWAKRHKILICSDSPYTFILNDEYISPLQVEGAKEVCLELVSLSKCYNMAGWRVGALVGNKEYIDTVLTFKSNMDSGMYRPIQEAAIVAMSEGDDWFARLNSIYQERREVVHKIMDILELSYDADTAGMFVWGKLPHDMRTSADVIDEVLKEARVFITPGHIFGPAGEGYIRISLCNTLDNIKEALRRIKIQQKHLA